MRPLHGGDTTPDGGRLDVPAHGWIRLRLGELDVGVGQQWARLSGLLDEALATEEQP